MKKKIVASKKKITSGSRSSFQMFDSTSFLLVVSGAAVVIIGIVILSSQHLQPFYVVAGASRHMPLSQSSHRPQHERIVVITNSTYKPLTTMIRVGDSVSWVNRDTIAYTVTVDDGSFDSGQIMIGEMTHHTFMKAGTYTYHCANHPSMIGTVIVE